MNSPHGPTWAFVAIDRILPNPTENEDDERNHARSESVAVSNTAPSETQIIFLENYLWFHAVLPSVMTEDTWDDLNKRVRDEWKSETTPFERIYEVLEQTHSGQSAAEIAERALVSEPTARRHLNSIVSTGFGTTTQDGRTTLYRHNDDRVLMTRIRELRDRASREELLAGIKRMKASIRDFEATYDALSPEELARQLPPEATDEWEDVTEWKTTRQNLAIAQAALAYDEASEQLLA